MGLLSKEIDITLCSTNIKHYEGLGYIIPREKDKRGRLTVPKGTKMKVDTRDLPSNSEVVVKIQCDYCKKELEGFYGNYNKYNHEGKYYCCNCANTVLHSGENNNRWNPNLSDDERNKQRKYPEYINFIKKVLNRDNYICKCCGKSDNNLEVHHLNSYDNFYEGRTDETNGTALCKTCHSNFHSIHGYGNNTKEQFEEWIGHTVEILKHKGELPTTRKIYCIEEDKIYNSAIDMAKDWNCTSTQIYSVCNRKPHCKSIKGKHLLWLDEYEKMSKEDIEKYLKDCEPIQVKVICITTNKSFNSLTEAQKYYNIKHKNGICLCCRGKRKSSGKLEDGTPLQWMYCNDNK